ncbi:MAG: metallophosphoesterase [Candidatus Omnitrophica bacterium]|nr:metallophosphoesterase [Candidatus Omnitrophota bacterium]
MRIIVISDTHIPEGADAIPQKLMEEVKLADMVIHAGDFIDLATFEKLKNACSKIIAVSGNMDPEEIKKKLPQKEIIKVGNFKIGIMHGAGASNKLPELLTAAFKNDAVDIIIFGHSHSPLNEKKGSILFFNPGSPTDKIFATYNSYGIIDINEAIEARIIKL